MWRKALSSAAFDDPITWKVWCWCLLRANYEPIPLDFQGEEIAVDRGQFVTGTHSMNAELNLSRSTIWRHIHKLEKWGNISVKVGRRYSVVSINNYESYQNPAFVAETKEKRTENDSEIEMGTDKEYKKVRKEETDYTSILNHWNSIAKQHNLATVIRLSSKRKRAVDARLQEGDFDFGKIVEEIGRSEFLRGSTGWRVDFDFVFCSANNYLKILEGKYRDATTRTSGKGNSQQARASFKHGGQEIARLKALKETLDNRDREGG